MLYYRWGILTEGTRPSARVSAVAISTILPITVQHVEQTLQTPSARVSITISEAQRTPTNIDSVTQGLPGSDKNTFSLLKLFIQTSLAVKVEAPLVQITRVKHISPFPDAPAKAGSSKRPTDITLPVWADTTCVEILTESRAPGATPPTLTKDGSSVLSQNVPTLQQVNLGTHSHKKRVFYTLIPVNCSVSEWTDWDVCSKACEGGDQGRTRSVQNPGTGGGKVCPHLSESRECNKTPCPKGHIRNCAFSHWVRPHLCLLRGLHGRSMEPVDNMLKDLRRPAR